MQCMCAKKVPYIHLYKQCVHPSSSGHFSPSSSRPLGVGRRPVTLGSTNEAAGLQAMSASTAAANHTSFQKRHTPDVQPPTPIFSLLLAAAALAAAPALLLLDIAEQATLAAQRLQQRAVSLLQAGPAEQQDATASGQLPAVAWHSRVRPLLPLWPPALFMTLAVAPVLLLLIPGCRQACAPPLLLLAASLVIQAYLDLQLAVMARVKARRTTAAAPSVWGPPVGAADAVHQAGAGPRQLIQEPAVALPPVAAASTLRLFACLRVGGDVFRCICCCVAAGLTVQALPIGAEDRASSLLLALQRCLDASGVAQLAAAVYGVLFAVHKLAAVWWSPACVSLLCCASARVHGLSALARCHV